MSHVSVGPSRQHVVPSSSQLDVLSSLHVCLWLLLGWSAQGPRRRPLFHSKRILRCSHLPSPRLGWLKGLGRHESCQRQASSGSLRLSRLSVLYSFKNQVRAELQHWNENTAYKTGVYILLKLLDEKVAKLRLFVLGAAHTVIPVTSDLAEMLPHACRYVEQLAWIAQGKPRRKICRASELPRDEAIFRRLRTKPSVSSWRLGMSPRT